MLPSPAVPGALLLCLDMQAPFVCAVATPEIVTRRCPLALRAARGLGIARAFTEQAPEKLGPTLDELIQAAGDAAVLPKTTFSALANDAAKIKDEYL